MHRTDPSSPLPQAKYRVMAACGDDVRLYSSPLIKFSKACTQLVSGRIWFLTGEQRSVLQLLLLPLPLRSPSAVAAAAAAAAAATSAMSMHEAGVRPHVVPHG